MAGWPTEKDKVSAASNEVEVDTFPEDVVIGEVIAAETLREIEDIESNLRTAEQLAGSIILR